jgi:hypothetical protein
MAIARHQEAVMSRIAVRRRGWLIITVVTAALAWTAALPAAGSTQSAFSSPSPSATASTQGPFSSASPCPGAPLTLKLGTTTPVLLVHGFTERPGVFTKDGSPPLADAIRAAVPDVTTITFDYHLANTDWVTNPAIGPQLAQCITWLAHTSDTLGGPGKVIIVAHSMGGLAVRCAVDPGCVQNGGKGPAANPNLIRLVVTLGTPNFGSVFGNVANFVASGYAKAPKAHVKPAGPFESIEGFLCKQLPQCPQLAAAAHTRAAKAMQIGSAELNPDALKPLPSSMPLDAIAGKITLTTTLLDAGLFTVTGDIGDIGDVVVSVESAQDPQGPSHAGPGNWQPTIDCGSIPIDSLPEWAVGKLAFQQSLVKCWHVTETTDPAWQSDIIAAIKPVAQTLSLRACTSAAISAALATKDPTNAAQRTVVAYACDNGWAVAEVHQPLTLSDGSVVQDTGYAILKQTDPGWSSEGLGDGVCLNAGVCPGYALPPPAVLLLLVQKAGISLASTQAELYINTAFTPGALYKYPSGPPRIGIDNHNYISDLQWAAGSQGDLIGTGTLHYDDCNPDCASGTYHTSPVQITASDPQQCSVQIYPQGLGNPSQTVQADVFNRINVQALQGNPPSFLVGNPVVLQPGPCT